MKTTKKPRDVKPAKAARRKPSDVDCGSVQSSLSREEFDKRDGAKPIEIRAFEPKFECPWCGRISIGVHDARLHEITCEDNFARKSAQAAHKKDNTKNGERIARLVGENRNLTGLVRDLSNKNTKTTVYANALVRQLAAAAAACHLLHEWIAEIPRVAPLIRGEIERQKLAVKRHDAMFAGKPSGNQDSKAF